MGITTKAAVMPATQDQEAYGSVECEGLNPFSGEWILTIQSLAKSSLKRTPKYA